MTIGDGVHVGSNIGGSEHWVIEGEGRNLGTGIR